MIALDTNILVRFLVGDDEKQARAVHARFNRAKEARERLFVPLAVALELIWVLESGYGCSREEILRSLDSLRGLPFLEFEADAAIGRVLETGRDASADLADILIAAAAAAKGCEGGITFDKGAAKLPFFELLKG